MTYCPPCPTGESDVSLERIRVELISGVKKNSSEMVRMKMEKIFAYRRYEVVCDTPVMEISEVYDL